MEIICSFLRTINEQQKTQILNYILFLLHHASVGDFFLLADWDRIPGFNDVFCQQRYVLPRELLRDEHRANKPKDHWEV